MRSERISRAWDLNAAWRMNCERWRTLPSPHLRTRWSVVPSLPRSWWSCSFATQFTWWQKVRADYPLTAPEVTESEVGPEFRIAALDALVRMKLTSYRLKDRVHLLDLLEVGLIDETWCGQMPPELGQRLRDLMETRDREL